MQLSAKDLLHEGSGHLLGGLLLHGVRSPAGVRHGQLRGEENQDQHQTSRGVPGEGEKERSRASGNIESRWWS